MTLFARNNSVCAMSVPLLNCTFNELNPVRKSAQKKVLESQKVVNSEKVLKNVNSQVVLQHSRQGSEIRKIEKENFSQVSKSVSNAATSTGFTTPQVDSRHESESSTKSLTPSLLIKNKKQSELDEKLKAEAAAKDVRAIEKVLSGDVSGFKELVERYEKRVYNVALAVLGNPEDAKDIAQEAFLRVYQKIDSFRGESSFYTWLYRVTFNLSVDLSRKRYRSRELGFSEKESNPLAVSNSGVRLESISESKFSGALEGPSEALERGELNIELNKALASLSVEHRAVIAMRELDGLSYSEISEAVGISKGTVMSRLHHARKKLQQLLKDFKPVTSEPESEDKTDLAE